MDESSTPSIPEPTRAGDPRQQRAHAASYRLEKRLRTQNREIEMNEGEEPIDGNEQEHHVDISV
ncbi:MAG: hypothetical protein ABSC21_09605 [Terriglobia bacterium]